MCDREESRAGEKMMRCFANVVDKANRFSISTEDVAKCMVKNSLKTKEGTGVRETLEHHEMLEVAKE